MDPSLTKMWASGDVDHCGRSFQFNWGWEISPEPYETAMSLGGEEGVVGGRAYFEESKVKRKEDEIAKKNSDRE